MEAMETSITEEQPRLKHSGPGIASFILGLSAGFLLVISLVIIIVAGLPAAEELSSGTLTDEEILGNPAFIAIAVGGLLVMLSVIVAIAGFILGIVGIAHKNRKKLFGILGTIISSLVALFLLLSTVLNLLG